MRTRIVAIALVALLPAAGLAQKGGSKGSDDQGGAAGGGSGAKSPSSRDLSDMSPASLLLDKKKKLSLADSTVNQLKAAQKKISDRNAAFYAGYDSTRKWTMPLSEALAVIPESQKAAATELIEAQTAEVEKRLGGR